MKIVFYFIIIILNSTLVYSQNAPEGAIHPSQHFRSGFEKLSTDYPYAQAWFQAATLKYNIPNDGYVKVDYFKFFEIDLNNNRREVDRNEYNVYDKYFGGLFTRNPKTDDFCKSKLGDMDNVSFDGKHVVVFAGMHGDKVSHWWSNRVEGKIGSRYEVEIKFLIHGEIGLQIGCDFYRESAGEGSNMLPEPWTSYWFGDTDNKYRTETVPLYDLNEQFRKGKDYGVTTQGKFFISKRLFDHCGGSLAPHLLSSYGTNGWHGTPMNLVNDNWIYESNTRLDRDTKIKFCFHVIPSSSGHYLPHIIVDDGTLVDKEDAIKNSNEGYNFYIYPIEE